MPRIFPPGLPLIGFALADPRNDELLRWCGERIPHAGDVGFSGGGWAVGVVRRRELAAVVVFHDWQRECGTVQLSCAADTPLWASRCVVGGILGLAFNGTLGEKVRKVFTVTSHKNERALKFNEGVGFKREATLREHFGPKDHAVIYSMMGREYKAIFVDRAKPAKGASMSAPK